MKKVIKVLLLILSTFCSFVYPLLNVNESNIDIEKYFNSLNLVLKKVSTSPFGNLPIDAFFLHNYFNTYSRDKLNDLQLIHNTSDVCLSDLMFILREMSKPSKNIWLIKLLDSFGKLEAGLLEGNLHWEGDYWQCIDVAAPSSTASNSVRFNGQYCTAKWSLANAAQLYTGACVPDSCTSQDIEQESRKMEPIFKAIPLMNKIFDQISLISFDCLPTIKLETHTIIYIAFFIFLTSLIVLATIIDIIKCNRFKNDDQRVKEHDDKENLEDGESSDTLRMISKSSNTSDKKLKCLLNFIICFSLCSNTEKLFQLKRKSRKDLKCIHGIRVLSMFWIIIGHTYAIGFSMIKRPLYAFKEIDNLPFYTIINGTLSVDTFFTLSGFLLSYLFFSQNPIKFSFFKLIYFYFHRYWRLIPVYAFVIWTTVSFLPHLSSGPYWNYNEPLISILLNCPKSWWYNLLFASNFIDFSSSVSLISTNHDETHY